MAKGSGSTKASSPRTKSANAIKNELSITKQLVSPETAAGQRQIMTSFWEDTLGARFQEYKSTSFIAKNNDMKSEDGDTEGLSYMRFDIDNQTECNITLNKASDAKKHLFNIRVVETDRYRDKSYVSEEHIKLSLTDAEKIVRKIRKKIDDRY